MTRLILITITVLMSGCAISPAQGLKFTILCDREVMDMHGFHLDNAKSIENKHHIRCDKHYPLKFSWSL